MRYGNYPACPHCPTAAEDAEALAAHIFRVHEIAPDDTVMDGWNYGSWLTQADLIRAVRTVETVEDRPLQYPEWIRVEDRLPERDVDVLVLNPEFRGPRQYVARWLGRSSRDEVLWEYGDGEYGVYDVTHWMPLPDPPKGTE